MAEISSTDRPGTAPRRPRPLPGPRPAAAPPAGAPPAAPEQRPAPHPRRWIPLVLIIGAVVALTAAGVSYVLSPNWGRHNATAAPRNVGTVPVVHGRTVAYVSPNRIEIPRLHVSAPIVPVGTTDRELDIPLNPKIVGWWAGGARPGQRTGTAILAGHINYAGVTGVLSRIGTLNPGDTVYVIGRHQGRTVRLGFRITGVRTYRKTSLPYRQIFDQRSVGRLAIVTCGGPFDASTGNYLDNIVAFAVPA